MLESVKNFCLDHVGKESEYRKVLAQDGQEKLMLALTSFEAVCGELKNAEIKVKTLQLIDEHTQHFLDLCGILKIEGVKEISQKRLAELKAFGEERDGVIAFIRICSMLKQGTISSCY